MHHLAVRSLVNASFHRPKSLLVKLYSASGVADRQGWCEGVVTLRYSFSAHIRLLQRKFVQQSLYQNPPEGCQRRVRRQGFNVSEFQSQSRKCGPCTLHPETLKL